MKRFIILCAILVSISYTAAQQSSAQTSGYPFPLDVHVHWHPSAMKTSPGEKDGFDSFLSQKKVQKAFLISPSYNIDSSASFSDLTLAEKEYFSNSSHRGESDQQTAQMVRANPDRFYGGLCGFNINWSDAVDVVTSCLKQKEMVGIKIRSETTESRLSRSEDYNRLQHLFENVSGFRPVVLWHIDTMLEHKSADKTNFKSELHAEMAKLYEIIRRNPKITFIIAHSFYSAESVTSFSILEKQQGRLINLFVEPSTNWHNVAQELSPEFVTAWRQIGFDRMVFGSDLGFIQEGEFHQFIDAINKSPLLTLQEKKSLMITTPLRLLSSIQRR